jgi:hypothetical protein
VPVRTNQYQFSSTSADAHYDAELGLALGRFNKRKRWVVLPKSDTEKVYVGPYAVGIIVEFPVSTEALGRLAGASLIAMSERRLVGIITQGLGLAGESVEAGGRFEGFSVELNEIAHASVVRNWRGKPRAILLRGGAEDPLRIEISDVVATVDFNTADGKPYTATGLVKTMQNQGIQFAD